MVTRSVTLVVRSATLGRDQRPLARLAESAARLARLCIALVLHICTAYLQLASHSATPLADLMSNRRPQVDITAGVNHWRDVAL